MSNHTPTLGEMQTYLQHGPKAESGGGSSKKGGKWDESKVKRDGQGQFASSATNNKINPKDAAWLKSMTTDKINDLLTNNKSAWNKFTQIYSDAIKASGKSTSQLSKLSGKEAATFYNKIATRVNREVVPMVKEFSSPSSGLKVRVYHDPVKGGINTRVEDSSGRTVQRSASPINIGPGRVSKGGKVAHSDVEPPTISEMENELLHFGIKGMRWGVRRTDAELGRAKARSGEDGELSGNVRAKTIAAAVRLKKMVAGETIVVDTQEGPKVLVKQKDGSFKETGLSADAEKVMRTLNKAPSEMSTRELKEAAARAKAVEEYNRIFNPVADPNAELKARAEAMELNAKVSKAYAQMNPSRTKRVSNFIGDMAPAFSAFQTADKAVNGLFSDSIKDFVSAMRAKDDDSETSPTTSSKQNFKINTSSKKKRRFRTNVPPSTYSPSTRAEQVFDITSMPAVGSSSDPLGLPPGRS